MEEREGWEWIDEGRGGEGGGIGCRWILGDRRLELRKVDFGGICEMYDVS